MNEESTRAETRQARERSSEKLLSRGKGSKGEPLSGSETAPMEFKWISGWEGLYAVTAEGKILSCRYSGSNGNNWRELKQFTTKDGYCRVSVARNGLKKNLPVHRAVAEAFLGIDPSKPVVNHKNCVKTDNRAENLEWVTPIENVMHTVNLNRHVHLERHPMAKLKIVEVLEIRRLKRTTSISSKQLALMNGVSKSTISRIIHNRNWRISP